MFTKAEKLLICSCVLLGLASVSVFILRLCLDTDERRFTNMLIPSYVSDGVVKEYRLKVGDTEAFVSCFGRNAYGSLYTKACRKEDMIENPGLFIGATKRAYPAISAYSIVDDQHSFLPVDTVHKCVPCCKDKVHIKNGCKVTVQENGALKFNDGTDFDTSKYDCALSCMTCCGE